MAVRKVCVLMSLVVLICVCSQRGSKVHSRYNSMGTDIIITVFPAAVTRDDLRPYPIHEGSIYTHTQSLHYRYDFVQPMDVQLIRLMESDDVAVLIVPPLHPHNHSFVDPYQTIPSVRYWHVYTFNLRNVTMPCRSHLLYQRIYA